MAFKTITQAGFYSDNKTKARKGEQKNLFIHFENVDHSSCR